MAHVQDQSVHPSSVIGGDAEAMEAAAGSWLASLDQSQRRRAQASFEHDRFDWHYVPRHRPGLALRDMQADQREGVRRLLEAVLSERGLSKAYGVIALEAVLGEITRRTGFRDAGNYALAIFGAPGSSQPWAWRIEGHHLSLTFTILPGIGIAATPSFFGANPAVVPHSHPKAGSELLDVERELAFELLGALDEDQLRGAVIADRAPADIVTGPGRETSLRAPQGLPFAALGNGRLELAMQLVTRFIDHLRPSLVEIELARIGEAGADAIHFAWAGSPVLGKPHYFRLHGPSLVVEYDNTQDGANHVHTVWHDPTNSFGDDMLCRHYHESAHH